MNHKQEPPMAAILVVWSTGNMKLCTGSPIHHSYKVIIHLCLLVSEEKIFRNRPIRNKNCLWQPCLLTNRDEMSNLYRGPAINASYQVSLYLAVSEEKIKMWKINRWWTQSDDKSSNCLLIKWSRKACNKSNMSRLQLEIKM